MPDADDTRPDPLFPRLVPPHRHHATDPDVFATRVTAVATSVAPPDPERLCAPESLAARYEVRDKLGEGGMGEVHLCADHRIGREIAMKVIRTERGAQPDARRRFLREARVQGQLEHPSIVPVYDLGADAHGAAFFTMKRVRGMTLEQVLDKIRVRNNPDEETLREYSRHKLLTVFGSACLAVHFAHTRGVLHRDLKPDNVMMGDFGEVYVLDWGLAKVMGDASVPESARDRAVTPDAFLDDAREAPRTAHGSIMGTPGYMAPEQIHGDIDALDPRTDVYALGAILYELLTLDPLHGKGSGTELMKSTVMGAEARASLRAPHRDVPPELEDICVRATATRPADRFPSARALHQAVEAFLSGDRDVERRRELARAHAAAAEVATDRALAGGAGSLADRSRAMQEVSRAVALDPTNADALRTLARLFTEVPRELPPEAKKELEGALGHSQRVGARAVALGYLSWLAYLPLVLWMGLQQPKWGTLCDVLFFLSAIASAMVARVRAQNRRRAADVAMVVSTIAIISSVGLFGPFTLLPGLAAVNTLIFVVSADRSRRALAIALGCLAIIIPFALEQLGLRPASNVFRDGTIVTVPQIAAFPPGRTLGFLLLTNVALVISSSIFVARIRDALHDSQERLYFQTWQLRQFVPGAAYGAVAPPPAPSTVQLG
jgi:serine/threonine-protein kinase